MKPDDLANFRKRHDLTPSALADLLGVHKSQISRWENERREPPLWLEKFLACLGEQLPEPETRDETTERERLEAMGQMRLFPRKAG